MSHPKTVGVLVFDDVELLDFTGPIQVLASAMSIDPDTISTVEVVGLNSPVSISKITIEMIPDFVIDDDLSYDILIVPGGVGTRALIHDEDAMQSIGGLIERSGLCASVCTGSLLLAKLGLLSGLKATTHWSAIDLMGQIDSTIDVDRTRRYYDHGRYIVAEGVSAGIDMSFYLLEKLYGPEVSAEVRRYIEYYPEKA